MRDVYQDVQFAVRLLRQSPGFTLTALLAIALATGANTAVFSMVYSVVLRPLPFPDPSRLVSITRFYPEFNQSVVTSPTYFDWRAGGEGAVRSAAYSMGDYTLSIGESAERIPAALVSSEFFEVLGIRPRWGRTFSADEDKPGGPAVAIVSEGFAKERLDGSAGILNRRLELDGRSFTIMGVMPAAFAFPPAVRVWIPLALNPADRAGGGPIQLVRVIGRLSRGTAESDLAQRLEVISRRSPESAMPGAHVAVVPLRTWLTGKTQQVWFMLLGAVALMELEWRAVQPAAISTASENRYACGIVGETGEGMNGDCLQ